jgi:hypothetical protein
MNIHFERSGGFAGLRVSHDVDSADLSPDDGKELERLVESAGVFDVPAEMRAANPGVDRFQYKLTVKDSARERTVSLDDAAVPEKMRPLLNWLTTHLHKL